MSFFIKDEDLDKPIKTFPYLKKGDGRKARMNRLKVAKQPFLKRGEGKLASANHGVTEFAKKRMEQIVKEQGAREQEYWDAINQDENEYENED